MEDDRLGILRPPVLIEDAGAVLSGDRVHRVSLQQGVPASRTGAGLRERIGDASAGTLRLGHETNALYQQCVTAARIRLGQSTDVDVTSANDGEAAIVSAQPHGAVRLDSIKSAANPL